MTAPHAPVDGTAEPYQVMPALTEVEFASLKESLREHGCLVAIEYDENGDVLDGHHRLRALRELGIKSHPRVIRAGLGGVAEKVAHALALNVHRRHLTPKQRADAVLRLRDMGWSVRRIAAQTGIPRSTVSRDLQASADGGPEAVVGADGKTYAARQPVKPTTVYVHSDHQQRTAEDALRTLGDEQPAKTVELRRLERMRRQKIARTSRETLALQPGVETGVDLRCSAIADLEIESESVDLILTDPPYAGLECWEDGGPWDVLGKQALRWLKPGGLLLAYTGHMHVARTLEVLSRYEADGLNYWWLYAVTFPGGSGLQVHSRAITVSWRPVVAYRKAGGTALPRFSGDPVVGGGKEKNTPHEWQQGLHEARILLDRLTTPGALVVDPFVGSGTVAVAATSLEQPRRVIAADIDAAYVALTQRRVAEAAGLEGT